MSHTTTLSPALPSPVVPLGLGESRQRVIERLADEVRRREGPRVHEAGIVTSGCSALDRLLPRGGFRRGSLVEWVAATPGAGATTVALAVAARAGAASEAGARAGGGKIAIIDPAGCFYPPAAVAWGIRMDDLLLVRPGDEREARWATDQALRCAGLAAVVVWPTRLDAHTFRRWQLAAEQSGVLGLMVRPAEARREPSWAEARLLVAPRRTSGAMSEERRRRLRIEVLSARGGALQRGLQGDLGGGPGIEVMVNHETHALEFVRGTSSGLPVVSQLADPELRRAVGA